MNYLEPQEPRTVTAKLCLCRPNGEVPQSKDVLCRITHTWRGNPRSSIYNIDVLEEVTFETPDLGAYLVMVFIRDERLGEFWVDMNASTISGAGIITVTPSAGIAQA